MCRPGTATAAPRHAQWRGPLHHARQTGHHPHRSVVAMISSPNRHAITVTDDQVGRIARPPGEGRPVFLPVRGTARRSVRRKGSRNVPAVTSLFSHSAKRTAKWARHQRPKAVLGRRPAAPPGGGRWESSFAISTLLSAPEGDQTKGPSRDPLGKPRPYGLYVY